MIPNFPDAGSQSDELSLYLPDSQQTIDRWISYNFDSDFLKPSDSWSFVTGGANLSAKILDGLFAGARVLLKINGLTQGGGFIDSVDTHYDREGGTVYTISGRDVFGPVVDSGADERLYTFTPEMTLEDVVHAIFANYGFTKPSQFDISNDANRTVMTGVRTTTKKGKPLKATKIAQQLRPYPNEGVFQYLDRFLHRFGVWCWPSADQSTVIVSTPSYDSPVRTQVVRRADGSLSNVVSGGVLEDATDQPAAILAFGASYGQGYGRAALKVIVPNELTGVIVDRSRASTQLSPTGPVLGLISRYPDAKAYDPRPQFSAYLKTLAREDPVSRPQFLQDDEAKTLDQLTRFAYRQLSLAQQRMWTAHYLVEGHTQRVLGGQPIPWAVDTMVQVDDEAGRGFHGPMYLRGRTFTKSRDQGTTTLLRLILPHTIDFGNNPS